MGSHTDSPEPLCVGQRGHLQGAPRGPPLPRPGPPPSPASPLPRPLPPSSHASPSLALPKPSSVSGLTAHPSARTKLPRCRDDPLAPRVSSNSHVDARPPQVSSPHGRHVHSGPQLHQRQTLPRASPWHPLTQGPGHTRPSPGPQDTGHACLRRPFPIPSRGSTPSPVAQLQRASRRGTRAPAILAHSLCRGVRKQAPNLSFLVCEVRTPQHPLQGLR